MLIFLTEDCFSNLKPFCFAELVFNGLKTEIFDKKKQNRRKPQNFHNFSTIDKYLYSFEKDVFREFQFYPTNKILNF
ncbi:hypothetical protein CDL62_15200 [Alkalitalea saponilacus]|nr:hypothetical protein CDL62_14755 [Alkalitalea saponilacus]ASB50395.1 hypothetical protein CDL62_15200 [Alkalitalea saponilacus]